MEYQSHLNIVVAKLSDELKQRFAARRPYKINFTGQPDAEVYSVDPLKYLLSHELSYRLPQLCGNIAVRGLYITDLEIGFSEPQLIPIVNAILVQPAGDMYGVELSNHALADMNASTAQIANISFESAEHRCRK